MMDRSPHDDGSPPGSSASHEVRSLAPGRPWLWGTREQSAMVSREAGRGEGSPGASVVGRGHVPSPLSGGRCAVLPRGHRKLFPIPPISAAGLMRHPQPLVQSWNPITYKQATGGAGTS